MVNVSDLVELVEPNAVEITDNIVFRKLLVSLYIFSGILILKIQFHIKAYFLISVMSIISAGAKVF